MGAALSVARSIIEKAPICAFVVGIGLAGMALWNQRTFATSLDMSEMGKTLEWQIERRFDILEKRQDISDSKALIENYTRSVHERESEQAKLQMLMAEIDPQQSPQAYSIIEANLHTLSLQVRDLRQSLQVEQGHLRLMEAEFRRLTTRD